MSIAIARAAAHELLTLGLENLAYVAWWEFRTWSAQRGTAFEEILSHYQTRNRTISIPLRHFSLTSSV